MHAGSRVALGKFVERLVTAQFLRDRLDTLKGDGLEIRMLAERTASRIASRIRRRSNSSLK